MNPMTMANPMAMMNPMTMMNPMAMMNPMTMANPMTMMGPGTPNTIAPSVGEGINPEQYAKWFEQWTDRMAPANYEAWLEGFKTTLHKMHGKSSAELPPGLLSPESYAEQFKVFSQRMHPDRYQKWFGQWQQLMQKQAELFQHQLAPKK